ncbi:NUDIX domain-containing protein [Streptosporangium canum]|uniref:NUDIX hydrolase n=1 Tax=Streptosporangium canum TaxID=324952 RepID=UPI00343F3AEC
MATNEEQTRWVVHGERLIYDNRWIRLGLVDVAIPDGERFEHHVVHLDRAAIAVAVDDQNRVLLMWRHRFLADRWGWELPGGLIDAGEDAMATAAREHISPLSLSDNSEVERQRQAAGLGDQVELGGESAAGPFAARPCRSARLVAPRRIIQPRSP